ncbi:hypothetical protein WA026_023413 [Henosepilachna vigintioctopunctata]|uniref:Proline-rich nuclear receptor coactivator 2 n=1 Tax=Henosepilachna vigintioctopunctata TaxID=420089 RepID=A0AAW1TY43_9CUCU
MCLTYENCTVAMAKRNLESSGKTSDTPRVIESRNNISRSTKNSVQESNKNSECGKKSPESNDQQNRSVSLSTSPLRTYNRSPIRKSISPVESIGKQYAGCKWTEPPSPSALPHPPKHWMQTSKIFARPFQVCQTEQDFSQQLKVLLKVQA